MRRPRSVNTRPTTHLIPATRNDTTITRANRSRAAHTAPLQPPCSISTPLNMVPTTPQHNLSTHFDSAIISVKIMASLHQLTPAHFLPLLREPRPHYCLIRHQHPAYAKTPELGKVLHPLASEKWWIQTSAIQTTSNALIRPIRLNWILRPTSCLVIYQN